MIRLRLTWYTTLIIALLGLVSATAQSTEDTIRIETRLVSVPTIVSDRNGRYIPHLQQSDFKVYQDGVEQKIEFFAAAEEPINVALLIDTSQSTRHVLDDIKDSARAFLKLLSPADRAMIVSFDYDTHILCQLTSDQETLKRAIKNAEIPERGMIGTTMRDAVFKTVNGAFRGLAGRKAIILLTDGKDVDSRIGRHELLYRLEESDTLIYSIMFKTQERMQRPMFDRNGRVGIFAGRMPPMRRDDARDGWLRERLERMNSNAEAFLQELSDTTAGRFAMSKDGKLKNMFAAIVDELRFQYRLGFYPPDSANEAPTHQLKVRVTRPDAVVRSRNSYRTVGK